MRSLCTTFQSEQRFLQGHHSGCLTQCQAQVHRDRCQCCHLSVQFTRRCAGLCDSVTSLPALHKDEACRAKEPPQLVRQSWQFP